MLHHQFAEHVAEIGSELQIALLVELLLLQTRPLAVNFAAVNTAAEREHHVGVAMIGAARAIFARGAPELAHGDDANVRHAVTQVLIKRRQRASELTEQIGELTQQLAARRLR